MSSGVKFTIFFIHISPAGQGGQQVVTQIIRGQAVSTAISGASPVATVTGQGAASPTAAGQTPPGTPRSQGQGQVKLTLAQLTQLTQVSERDKLQYVTTCQEFEMNAVRTALKCLRKMIWNEGFLIDKLISSNQKASPHLHCRYVEAASGVRCRSAGWCRWYPTGFDGNGSRPGPDHRSATGHTSRGHRHPRTRPAAHAGSAAQRPGATLPLHPLGLSCHSHIKHRYAEDFWSD